MEKKLKPCLICNSDRVILGKFRSYSATRLGAYKYYITCRNCGLETGMYKTKTKLIAVWNGVKR